MVYGKRTKKQSIEQYIDNLSNGKTKESKLKFLKDKFLTKAGVISKTQINYLISIINELVKAGFKLDASKLSEEGQKQKFLKRAGVQALYEFINFLIEGGLTVTITTKEIVEGEEITREIDVTVESRFIPSEAVKAEKERAEAEEEKKREDDIERRKEKEKEKKAKKKAEETKKAQKKVEKKAERAEKTEGKEKEKQKEAEEIEKQNKLSDAQILVAQHQKSVLNAETKKIQTQIDEIQRQQVIGEQKSEPAPPARITLIGLEDSPRLPIDEINERFGGLFNPNLRSAEAYNARINLNSLLTGDRNNLESTVRNFSSASVAFSNDMFEGAANYLSKMLDEYSENWQKLRESGSNLYDLVVKLIEIFRGNRTKPVKNLDGLFDEPKEAGSATKKISTIIKELDEQKQDKPDKKNEKEVLDNVELVQAPQVPGEQSFDQQVKNDESQEKQLKGQVNQGAEIVAGAEIKNVNDVNEAVINLPQGVEVVQFDSNNDVMMDMFENSENKMVEILLGNPRDQGVLPAPPDPMIEKSAILKEMRDILTNIKRRPIKPDELNELIDRYIDLKDKYGEFNFVDETDEIRKEVNSLIRSIRALLSSKENTSRLINARRKEKEAQRAQSEVSQAQERLSKTDKALNMIKSRVLNDGLLKPTKDQVHIEPNEETELIRESFEEIDQDIKENGVTNENLSKFIKIMRIVQEDTYSVVTSAVKNDPSILISPTGFAVGVGGGLLMRVLGRLLYSNTEIQDNEQLSTARVEAFYTYGNLQGVNPTVRERLLRALRVVVPVPPSLSDERESFQNLGESKEESRADYDKRTLRQRKRKTGLRKNLSNKITKMLGIFQGRSPTSATDPPTRGIYEFMEDLQSAVGLDLNESRNREKIILFYTSDFLFDEPYTRREVENSLLIGLNPSQIQAFAQALEQELSTPQEVQLFIDSGSRVPTVDDWLEDQGSPVSRDIGRISPRTLKERIRQWIARQKQRGKRLRRFSLRRTKKRVSVSPNAEDLSERFAESGSDTEDLLDFSRAEAKEEGIELEEPADGGEEFKEQQRTAIEKLRETIVLGMRAFLTTGVLRSREGLGLMAEKITENVQALAQRSPDVARYLMSAPIGVIEEMVQEVGVQLKTNRYAMEAVAEAIGEAPLQDIGFGFLGFGAYVGTVTLFTALAMYSIIQVSDWLFSEEEQQLDEPIYEERKLERGKTTEFNKGEEKPVSPEDIDRPQGQPLLRPEFNMTGIDFFNKSFDITPLDAQNSEWAEFDYAKKIDIQNLIEIDNALNDKIRFSGDMFYPEYVEPPKPPSNDAVILARTGMIDQIQLTQQFAPKFDGAVTIFDNLSNTRNHDAFSRSWQDNILYNQDRM